MAEGMEYAGRVWRSGVRKGLPKFCECGGTMEYEFAFDRVRVDVPMSCPHCGTRCSGRRGLNQHLKRFCPVVE